VTCQHAALWILRARGCSAEKLVAKVVASSTLLAPVNGEPHTAVLLKPLLLLNTVASIEAGAMTTKEALDDGDNVLERVITKCILHEHLNPTRKWIIPSVRSSWPTRSGGWSDGTRVGIAFTDFEGLASWTAQRRFCYHPHF